MVDMHRLSMIYYKFLVLGYRTLSATVDQFILATFPGGVQANPICDGTETCKFNFDEVCGSDGKTYVNKCVFNKVKCFVDTTLEVVRQGPCCPKSDSCPEMDMSAPDLGGGYTNDCIFWSDKCSLLKFTESWTKSNGEMLVSSLQTETGLEFKRDANAFLTKFDNDVNVDMMTWDELHLVLAGVRLLSN